MVTSFSLNVVILSFRITDQNFVNLHRRLFFFLIFRHCGMSMRHCNVWPVGYDLSAWPSAVTVQQWPPDKLVSQSAPQGLSHAHCHTLTIVFLPLDSSKVSNS